MAIEYKTLEQLLEERGLSMDALKDPGQRFGYGSGGEYGQFFSPFDIEGYQEGIQSLKGLESSLMGGIEQQFGFQAGKQRTGLQSQLQKIQQAGKPSGLTGGAQDRLMSMARQAGSESYGDLARQTSQRRTATQEQLGSQYGALQGMFTSFLGDSTTRALQITQADPTGGNQGRLVTAQDIESFNSRLGMGDRMSFNAAAQGLVGQDYQQLIDLYGDYAQNG
tara:strand:+ start:607 stop:1272 length:666 start_codon:yes stop_codon:yes gene_type:complete